MKKVFLFLFLLVSNCFPQYQSHWNNQPPSGYQINLGRPDAQGIIGLWLFNEGFGRNVYDLSPYDNNGTLTNMVEADDWVAGRDGYALDFDGIDDFIDVPDSPSLSPTTQMTFSIWVNQDAATANKAIAAKGVISSNWSWSIQNHNSNADRLRIFIASSLGEGGGNFITENSPGSLVANEWLNIVFVYNGSLAAASRLVLYTNGVLRATTITGTIPATMTDSNQPMHIGRWAGLGREWNGKLSTFEIYERAFLADEVKSLYNSYALFDKLIIAKGAVAAARRRIPVRVF